MVSKLYVNILIGEFVIAKFKNINLYIIFTNILGSGNQATKPIGPFHQPFAHRCCWALHLFLSLYRLLGPYGHDFGPSQIEPSPCMLKQELTFLYVTVYGTQSSTTMTANIIQLLNLDSESENDEKFILLNLFYRKRKKNQRNADLRKIQSHVEFNLSRKEVPVSVGI